MPDFLTGQRLTADLMNANSVTTNPPATYPVIWSSSSTTPNLGNGSLSGTYFKAGPIVVVSIKLLFGSTTTAGTGRWTFTLPFMAAVETALSGVADNGSRFPVNPWVTTGAGIFSIAYGTGSIGIPTGGGNVPFAWGNGHQLILGGSYLTNA